MTEYDLIEIMKRFRKLEDAIIYERHTRHRQGSEWVDGSLDDCRADMVWMQEEIRKAIK